MSGPDKNRQKNRLEPPRHNITPSLPEFLKKDEITSEIEGYMNKTMNGTAYDDLTTAEQDIINVIQSNLECCG